MYFNKAKSVYRQFVAMLLLLAIFFVGGGVQLAEAATFAERAASMAEIMDIRASSDQNHTRIVVDSDKELSFETSVLSNPQRIVVDIHGAWIKPGINKNISVGSRFVKNVRIAQHSTDTVRLVVESSIGANNRKFFPLRGGSAGYRLGLDFGNFQQPSGGAAIDFGKQRDEQSAAKEESTSEVDPDLTPVSGNSGGINPDMRPAEPAGDTEEDIKPVVEPEFTPGIKDKIIVLDPGHGGSDVGAIGPTGVTEKSVTIRIAKELQKQLKAEGATVIMTREQDTEVSAKKSKASDIEELQARCDVANKNEADIFISIHMDSFTSSTPRGTTGYYYSKGTKAAKRLSQAVSDGVVKELSTENRGIKSCNFYVVKHTAMPAILLEVAFISNDREEKLLNSEAGIKKAATGITNGIRKFFD